MIKTKVAFCKQAISVLKKNHYISFVPVIL